MGLQITHIGYTDRKGDRVYYNSEDEAEVKQWAIYQMKKQSGIDVDLKSLGISFIIDDKLPKGIVHLRN